MFTKFSEQHAREEASKAMGKKTLEGPPMEEEQEVRASGGESWRPWDNVEQVSPAGIAADQSLIAMLSFAMKNVRLFL